MVAASVVEGLFSFVPEQVQHGVGHSGGFPQPVQVQGGLVQGQQAVNDEGVVFQVAL